MQRSRGGGGAVAGGLNNAKLEYISDEPTVQRLKRDAQLRTRLAQLRDEIRKIQDEKEKNLRKFEPVRDKFADAAESEIRELLDRKSAIFNVLDELKIRQNSIGQARDTLKMLDFEMTPLLRAINESGEKIKEVKTSLENLEAQRAAMNLQFKSLTDVDQQIARVDGQLAAATKGNNTKHIASLTKQKAELDRAKRDVQLSYNIDDKIISSRRRLEHLVHELEKKNEQRTAIEEKRRTLRESLDASGSSRKEFDALRDELTMISKKLDAAKAKRKEKRPVNEELNEITNALSKLRAEREELGKELDALRDAAPRHLVDVDPEFRGDIIGKGGATMEQLQLDFGVAIDIDGPDRSCIEIFGAPTDAEACESAIAAIIEKSRSARQKATVPFDPELAKPFIGTRGSNIERLQTTSGASIRLSDDKRQLELTGTQEALEIAKKLIEEFMFNSCSTELKFDVAIREFIIGKGGSVIRRIEKESGVKRINVSSETGTLTIFGNRDAVAKAEAMYQDIITGMSGNAFTMRADDRMVRVIIGKGGETIRSIQEQSGAAININRGTVTIRGTKEAVEAARRLIEDVARRDEVKIPYDVHLHALLTTRPVATTTTSAAQPENGQGGEVQYDEQAEEMDCPLEQVRVDSGCDRVSALRAEQRILLVGKRENVNIARAMLEQLFRAHRPHVTRVPFPDVLRAHLVKRVGTGHDRASPLDRIKTDHPGVIACDINRETSMVEIAGSADAIKAAAAALEALIGEFKPFIRTIKFPGRLTGSIIGTGGKAIAELTARTRTEIRVDKDKSELVVLSYEKKSEQIDEVEKAIDALKAGTEAAAAAA